MGSNFAHTPQPLHVRNISWMSAGYKSAWDNNANNTTNSLSCFKVASSSPTLRFRLILEAHDCTLEWPEEGLLPVEHNEVCDEERDNATAI